MTVYSDSGCSFQAKEITGASCTDLMIRSFSVDCTSIVNGTEDVYTTMSGASTPMSTPPASASSPKSLMSTPQQESMASEQSSTLSSTSTYVSDAFTQAHSPSQISSSSIIESETSPPAPFSPSIQSSAPSRNAKKESSGGVSVSTVIAIAVPIGIVFIVALVLGGFKIKGSHNNCFSIVLHRGGQSQPPIRDDADASRGGTFVDSRRLARNPSVATPLESLLNRNESHNYLRENASNPGQAPPSIRAYSPSPNEAAGNPVEMTASDAGRAELPLGYSSLGSGRQPDISSHGR